MDCQNGTQNRYCDFAPALNLGFKRGSLRKSATALLRSSQGI